MVRAAKPTPASLIMVVAARATPALAAAGPSSESEVRYGGRGERASGSSAALAVLQQGR